MENRRLQRMERMLQKEINELFRLQTQRMSQTVILSVTRVRVNPELSMAKIFLSIYPSEKSVEILQSIQQNKSTFRYDLGRRISKYVRCIPELFLFIDDSLDYIEKIDHLLSSD